MIGTIAEALRAAAERLAPISDTARLDAEVLMAHALRVSRSDLLLRHTRDTAPACYPALVARRARHEPVAYIVGRQEFFGRKFSVTPDVLIPRSDSETTVAAALDACRSARRVLDCGTGSGVLLLTILAELPAACGIGIDRSAAALRVAAGNCARLGLAQRADFVERDWNRAGWAGTLGRFDCVVANPPYVEQTALLEQSVRDFEPSGALFAGREGLDDYRILVPQLPGLLEPGGVAVLEIGAAQAASVAQIGRNAGFDAQVRCDLADRPRAIILRKT